MGVSIDPEENETRVLHDLVDFRGKDVLEIGCGDGRMTWRYAELTRSVLGIDPNAEQIRLAVDSTPEALKPVVRFEAADISETKLPLSAFHIAILSWSL